MDRSNTPRILCLGACMLFPRQPSLAVDYGESQKRRRSSPTSCFWDGLLCPMCSVCVLCLWYCHGFGRCACARCGRSGHMYRMHFYSRASTRTPCHRTRRGLKELDGAYRVPLRPNTGYAYQVSVLTFVVVVRSFEASLITGKIIVINKLS